VVWAKVAPWRRPAASRVRPQPKCGLRRVVISAPGLQAWRWTCCQPWRFLTPALTPTGPDEAGFRWTRARQSWGHGVRDGPSRTAVDSPNTNWKCGIRGHWDRGIRVPLPPCYRHRALRLRRQARSGGQGTQHPSLETAVPIGAPPAIREASAEPPPRRGGVALAYEGAPIGWGGDSGEGGRGTGLHSSARAVIRPVSSTP
jgi:hypothetical protein